MLDLPLTSAQAANWLCCTADEIRDHVAAGRLKRFAGGADGAVSLNSVVVLAESLPVERGIFAIDVPMHDHEPRPRRSFDGGGMRSQHERPPVIVERRPLRLPLRRD